MDRPRVTYGKSGYAVSTMQMFKVLP